MRNFRSAAMAALAAMWLADPASAFAEGCLQKFSCRLYGECRLPCLDEVTGTSPAGPAGALDTQPTASLPQREGKAVAKDEVDRREPKRSSRRAAHQSTMKVGHHTAPQAASPHVVAGNAVASLDQLAGKPVSFGPPGSRSQALGRQLFAKLAIKVQETPLEIDNALDGVATGDIAAVLVVRPTEVARLGKLSSAGVHELIIPATAAEMRKPVVAQDEVGR